MVSTNISVMLFRCVYVCWRVVHMFVHVCCLTGWTQTVVQLRSFKVAFRAPGSESRKSRNLRDFFEICLGIFEDSKSHGMSYEISFHCKLCYSAIWSYDDVISNDLVSLIWWLRWFQIRGVSMCFILHFGKAFSLLKFHIRPCVAPSLDLCKYDVAWLALRLPCLLIPCYTFCATMMMMFFFFFREFASPKGSVASFSWSGSVWGFGLPQRVSGRDVCHRMRWELCWEVDNSDSSQPRTTFRQIPPECKRLKSGMISKTTFNFGKVRISLRFPQVSCCLRPMEARCPPGLGMWWEVVYMTRTNTC